MIRYLNQGLDLGFSTHFSCSQFISTSPSNFINMAEESNPQESATVSVAEGMEVELQIPVSDQTDGEAAVNGGKRKRDGGDESEKQKADETSAADENLVKSESAGEENDTDSKGPVSLGFKSFETSVEMFDYFFALLHSWSPNININKYEHVMLLDLLQKGHHAPEKKIGGGIQAFQVRFHPEYKSRCFFLIRNDDSVDDFSFRKCVDHILPLPENMKIKSDVNKALGGRYGGGRGGGGGGKGWRGRGRGRGGKPRN